MPSPYTSATNGNFKASGVNTWGQGIGVYPNTANDVVTVSSGHKIDVDDVYTHQLGAMTVNGHLNYLNDRNTSLLLGHANLTISSTGKVSMGTSANPIPQAYTSKLEWNPTSDSVIGLTKQAGGVFEAYGDSELYGSLMVSYLFANWTSGQTFTVEDNVSAKWKSGQTLYVHKNTTYASNTTDVAMVTISGTPTWDGTKSTITIVEAFPTGTFYAGGLVMCAARNIILGKLNPTLTIGNLNTNRPRIVSETTTFLGAEFYAKDIDIRGVGNFQLRVKEQLENFVLRNGSTVTNISAATVRYQLKKGIVCAHMIGNNAAQMTIEEVYFFGNTVTGCFIATNYPTVKKCYFFANGRALYGVHGLNGDKDTYIFGNSSGIRNCQGIYNGILGVSPKGQNSANTSDIDLQQGWTLQGDGLIIRNAKLRASTLILSRNSTLGSAGKCYSAHHNQVKDAHWTFDAFGDIIRNNTVKRTGGASSSIEIIPLSNCGADYPVVAVDKWTENNVPASQQTRTIYILGEGWTVFPTNAQFNITAEYLDQATGASTAIATSVLSSDTSTWAGSGSTQKYKATVTFTPAQAGQVRYAITLAKYEAASKIFVGNALFRGDGIAYFADWQDGESYLQAEFKQKFSIFGGNIIKGVY